ncbi:MULTISPECIES: NAD(P)-dependent oxidoreductase [Lonsdalea]|uniref:Hydroxyacid dehydrogenase n=3 Tax=Lonsdalea TaxID=1082702 RepID=A0ACD1JES4_9GAMM|nr:MULTISPECIES: NAD(P)-dependent oxidoreductase [Lonsdalea]OSM94531.1 hydroxyacid dehydrogenase [Lonsdalea populi]OSN01756.1 hydroxyacid dehydrogenase [Lonsdalea populi]RAT13513.1 hydroxyacid dehydrogenase [Lonsdalea quercina]RAT17203.1 hydroxyacid dehydrogenase [Lonsdalea quercina]RAT21609.1 hydroxyacid dehydrogenase [Lonsdalea populi]
MQKNVLMARTLPAGLVENLSSHFHLMGPLTTLDGHNLPEGADKAEVLLTMSSIVTGRALIDALPALKLVICYGSGMEFVDSAYLQQKGIALTNAAGSNAGSVAEFAFGQILASCRHILSSDAFLRSGEWKGNSIERYPLVSGLQGRRIGIYGLGEIGAQIARLAQAFAMEVGYHSRSPKTVDYRYLDSIEQLADWADVLVIAARGTPQNYHIIDADILRRLGADGHLINIARGMLVDENALCDALESGQLAGAALDVYEFEPEISARLLAAPNAILTPHVAANTHTAQQAQQQRMLDNVMAYFAGRPLIGRAC